MTTRNHILKRVNALRRKFDKWDVGGVLISSATNRRWLSGFTGSAGQLLITNDKALLATDFRYWEQAARQAPDYTLLKHNRTDEDNAAFFAAAGVKRIGLEAQYVTLAQRAALNKIEAIEWVPIKETAEPLRKVKSREEIEAIRAAAAITDRVMQQFNEIARPGLSEKALAWELEKLLRETGADAVAFDVIVASGPNAALPHHSPGDRNLKAGDPLIIDIGAKLNGYNSDLTRSFYLGNEPDEKFLSIYNLVQQAQTAVIDGIKPTMSGKEADALGRDVIAASGYGDYFGHGLGHGVGMDIHELPYLSVRSENEKLAVNMVVTIEPGIYLPGWGGVRIEDLGLITSSGFQALSQCAKRPAIKYP